MLAIILSVLGIGGIGAAAFMFPAFGLVLKAVGSSIWEFIKAVPWQVWVALAAALVVWRLYDYHVDTVADAFSNGYKGGYAAALEDVRIQSERNRREAETRRRSTENTSRTIVKEIQDGREVELADLRKRLAAAAQRLRAQAAGAQGGGGAVGANLSGVPGAAGTQPAQGAVDGGLVAVPREPLLSFAEGHDRCLIDRTAWEVWYARHKKLFDEWQMKPETSSKGTQRTSPFSTRLER
jgi:hypothetical protein